MKITFILGFHPNQRMNKRMRFLKEKHEVSLIYWEKSNVSSYGDDIAEVDCEKVSLKFDEKKIIDRLLATKKFEKEVQRKLEILKPECLYVQNLDIFLFAAKYCKKNNVKLIYEISDINRILIERQSSFIKKLAHLYFDYQERKYAKYISLLCYTSPAFLNARYGKIVDEKITIYVPNIPNLDYFNNYVDNSYDDFTVGFIGTVRYPEQLKMLASSTKKANVKLFIAGGISTGGSSGEKVSIEELKCINDNIEFYGPFDYPTEIAKLYSKINLNYAVYDKNLNNAKIALPNKLYESIKCNVPIVVSDDTLVGKIVIDEGIGSAVSTEDELTELILKMKTDKKYYYSLKQACAECSNLININEYNNILSNKIENISND